jgi:lipoate-protein ligase B
MSSQSDSRSVANGPEGAIGAGGATGAPHSLVVRDLGRRPYPEVLALQEDLVSKIAAGKAPNTLLLCEHDPVLTLGRGDQRSRAHDLAVATVLSSSASPAHSSLADPVALAERTGVPCHRISRGGGVTYHGPGQLVGYPIVHLEDHDLRRFLRGLERGLVSGLEAFGVSAYTRDGLTGVWVESARGEQKIASIGIACRRWVTFHGFALNVSTDLGIFRKIDPCGLTGDLMTSLTELLDRDVTLTEAVEKVTPSLMDALDR